VFHLWKARAAEQSADGKPGRLLPDHKRLLVHCGNRTMLELLEVQLEGRKRMPAEAFLNGQHLNENEALGETTE
jgi:methionyl-tRNA formyltransferase